MRRVGGSVGRGRGGAAAGTALPPPGWSDLRGCRGPLSFSSGERSFASRDDVPPRGLVARRPEAQWEAASRAAAVGGRAPASARALRGPCELASALLGRYFMKKGGVHSWALGLAPRHAATSVGFEVFSFRESTVGEGEEHLKV